jgi:hypothetical protein
MPSDGNCGGRRFSCTMEQGFICQPQDLHMEDCIMRVQSVSADKGNGYRQGDWFQGATEITRVLDQRA